jgi:hypothetical protein
VSSTLLMLRYTRQSSAEIRTGELTSNIMSHFEKHAILTEAQHGFRSRRSCESQLIYTVHELRLVQVERIAH